MTGSLEKSQVCEMGTESDDDDDNRGTTMRVVSVSGKFLETPNLKMFSFGDLKAATKSFKSNELLGEGGFGKVYKGWLDAQTLTPAKPGSGMMVAIKKLNPDSMQGVQEWQVSFYAVKNI